MGNDLIADINWYTEDLQSKKDWQVSRVYSFEHKFFKKEKPISVIDANTIVKKLERHWKILVTQVYPEYESGHGGDSWPISRRAAAINVYSTSIYPSVIVHEVSHGIADCITMFHSKKVKEPGHGALWSGIYAYNIELIMGIDIAPGLIDHSIRVVDREVIQKLREYFKNG